MNYGYVFIAVEVGEIKSENFAHLMDAHSCDYAGIVDLNPGNSMLSHEFEPGREKFQGFWQ
jgi:hypothetical protein